MDWSEGLDWLQGGLDVVGMIPIVGEAADLVNAGISVCRGNYLDAAISLVSMIPVAGAAGPLLKALKKLPPSLTKHLDDLLKVLKDLLKSWI